MYEESYQWFPSFTQLGELIEAPNPTSAIEYLSVVIAHLTTHSSWPPNRIHIFGFAQGGCAATEYALHYWREAHQMLGSVVSISGPLISYSTAPKKCTTPVLAFSRVSDKASIVAYKKAFDVVVEVKRDGEDGMPRSKNEWEPIMRFWSEKLGRRTGEGLYEVITGQGSA